MLHLMLVNEQHSLGVIVLSNGDNLMATGAEPFETIKNILSLFFECFKDGAVTSSALRAQGSLILFSPIILLVTRLLTL